MPRRDWLNIFMLVRITFIENEKRILFIVISLTSLSNILLYSMDKLSENTEFRYQS